MHTHTLARWRIVQRVNATTNEMCELNSKWIRRESAINNNESAQMNYQYSWIYKYTRARVYKVCMEQNERGAVSDLLMASKKLI